MHARVDGRDAPFDAAVAAAARLLAGARRPLVYLAPDLTCEAQREAVGLADRLRATLDSVTSASALPSILAAQEQGRATATLGEIRHRADVVVFWGVDPAARYPRFSTRYAPEAEGLHVGGGRRSRTVVAVDIGGWSGPADADLRVVLEPSEEVQALTRLAASFTGRPGASTTPDAAPSPLAVLAATLGRARYAALLADAEEPTPARDPGVASAFTALGQAINRRTRGATVLLRGGGNRSAADAVMTAQTGYPLAVDFSRGFPEYRPHDGTAAARLARADVDAILIAGSVAQVPPVLHSALTGVRCAIVGPRASADLFTGAHVAIDTGVAGIHDGGTAMRMDDVPLPLRAVVTGPPSAEHVLRLLRQRIDTM
jgi:formylmethanofuran dehydrogenase subunit B